MFKNLFTTLFFLAVLSVSSFANGGNTYELKEQDLITEIESKAPELEAKIEKQKEKIKEKIKNFSGELLSVAKENKTRYIDPTFTLDKDIPRYNKLGHQDGVLYKKGYVFNPIDYMKALPPDFIVFNPCDKNESDFVKELMKEYEEKSKDYMLVNSGCKNKELKQTEFKGKVYFLTIEMINKFQLEHTVSIVYVDKDKKRIAIKEIVVNEKDNN